MAPRSSIPTRFESRCHRRDDARLHRDCHRLTTPICVSQIIDRKIVQTQRLVNPETGIIEYRLPEQASLNHDRAQAVFATYHDEPVVFQVRARPLRQPYWLPERRH